MKSDDDKTGSTSEQKKDKGKKRASDEQVKKWEQEEQEKQAARNATLAALKRKKQEQQDAQLAAEIARETEQHSSPMLSSSSSTQQGSLQPFDDTEYYSEDDSEVATTAQACEYPDSPAAEAPATPPMPCFVANIPAYVPSDSETDDTDSESDTGKYTFSDEDFTTPPFCIDYKKRGKVLSHSLTRKKTDKAKVGATQSSGITQSLTTKISQEAFLATSDQTLKKQQLDHLSVIIGLNRPRSLSSRKNRLLEEELEKTVSAELQVRYFAVFWDFPWKRINPAKNKSSGNPPSYEEIRSFYQQLKKKDAARARQFRRNTENSKDRSRRMVPYRRIREMIKNHELTRELVHIFRQTNPTANIYLFFCDADTSLFNGCFTTYTQVDLQTKNKIGAMTTGYLFDSNNPMIRLASELDMRVREATTKHLPRGAYYPEPSLCIMVPTESDSVPESFEEKTDDGADYEAPQESPIILKKVATRPDVLFVFAFQNPLITRTPERATTNKTKTKKGSKNSLEFSATFNKSTNKFDKWTMQDLVNITKNSAQSHAHARSWAINILNGLKLETKDTVKEKTKKIIFADGTTIEIKKRIGNVIREIAISLLSRLFKSYDPISIAEKNRATLILILTSTYEELIKSDIVPQKVNASRKSEKELWAAIDNISSRKDLKSILAQLIIEPNVIDKIDLAARDAGKAIHTTLAAKLNLK
jgi:hypothetical protein